MKTTIDPFISATDWVETSDATIQATTWDHLKADNQSGQLLMKFPSVGGQLSKTYGVTQDISRYNGKVLFNIKANLNDTNNGTVDRKLKVRFYTDAIVFKEYYVPVSKQFHPVIFKTGFSQIKRIVFISIKPIEFFVSSFISYSDQLPYDCYEEIKSLLESNMPQVRAGTVTCSAGDKEITIQSPAYLERYCVIKIGSELHQIETKVIDKKIKFFGTFSGEAMLGSFSNEPVYLVPTVIIEPTEVESIIPGIAIANGFNARPIFDQERYSVEKDSFRSDQENPSEEVGSMGTAYAVDILIEGLARHQKIFELIYTSIRKSFNEKNMIWINGRKHELSIEQISDLDYGDATDILNKIQCLVTIEVTEDTETENMLTVMNYTETVQIN
ncbi:hypothetical protein [Leptospira phage LE3]|uniref:Uncharacterized protein n=1 Tax=Leptospira phage LE3 TaxID=2041382 RepID=A0A343LE52_9CAUD|nr:hypothetical protein HWB33_gp32 [Leptospira phage LE3]ATN94962.1 hypothetical protein [Leptospira phage LE3]